MNKKTIGVGLLIAIFVMGVKPVFCKPPTNKNKSVAPLPKETKGSSKMSPRLEAWIKRMKRNANKAQTRQHRLIAVAAVRGNEVQDAPPLYWKTKPVEGPIKPEDLEEFKQALNMIENGDVESAKIRLDSLASRYSEGSLRADIDQTLKVLAMEDQK